MNEFYFYVVHARSLDRQRNQRKNNKIKKMFCLSAVVVTGRRSNFLVIFCIGIPHNFVLCCNLRANAIRKCRNVKHTQFSTYNTQTHDETGRNGKMIKTLRSMLFGVGINLRRAHAVATFYVLHTKHSREFWWKQRCIFRVANVLVRVSQNRRMFRFTFQFISRIVPSRTTDIPIAKSDDEWR